MPEVISIDLTGNITFIGDDDLGLSDEGQAETRRASHVVPAHFWKRLAFRSIRSLVSDGSSWAAWTRDWRGPWLVDLSPSDGPTLGPFKNRAFAIAAEVAWLQENLP